MEEPTVATHEVDKPTQAQISATGTVAANNGNGFREAQSARQSSIRSISDGNKVEGNSKSGKRLLPIKQNSAVGNSYVQSAIDPRPLLLEERNRDSYHKVYTFSSSKMPQPFLDR